MHISWDHIRTFHAVAEHGSLLAASRHLGLTQPTVGRHITLLEEQLGFALFTRGREGVRLTEKGADLIGAAQEMQGSSLDFARLVSGLEETAEGTVRISANEILGGLLLPQILVGFMVEHPMIEVEIEVSNAVTDLLRRDADIAIRMFRPTQNDLVARKIIDLPLGLYAARRYLERRPAPQTLEGLRQHVLIGEDRSSGLLKAYEAAGVVLERSAFQFRCDSNIASIEAVRSGIGIGALHKVMAERWPDVMQLLPDIPAPSLELWLACHADVRHNKRVRLMMDFLAERLRTPYGPH